MSGDVDKPTLVSLNLENTLSRIDDYRRRVTMAMLDQPKWNQEALAEYVKNEAIRLGKWAHFRLGYHFPDYAVAASWGTAMPGHIQCASYSGWFVEGVPLADPPRRRGINVADGILPNAEMAPTHWMRCPKL